MQFSSLRFAVALSSARLGSAQLVRSGAGHLVGSGGESGWGQQCSSEEEKGGGLAATISPWWRVSGASTLPQGSVWMSMLAVTVTV